MTVYNSTLSLVIVADCFNATKWLIIVADYGNAVYRTECSGYDKYK